MNNYIEINKNAWNNKVDIHVNSDFYEHTSFIEGKNTLKTPELELLGDIKGKKILHLQCHFGQDTMSLSRMGANVVGVDFSEKAIELAKVIAKQLDLDTQFILSDIYTLNEKLNDTFDIVFTSYGTIGWLPDLDAWAKIIKHYLNPNGKFIMIDFHPVVWMYDDYIEKLTYNYFKDEAIYEKITGTYADRNANLTFETLSWNHSISEILNSLLNSGINLKCFNEYPYSTFNCFKNMKSLDNGTYVFENKPIPIMYGIVAEI